LRTRPWVVGSLLLAGACGDAAGPGLPTLAIVTDSLPRGLPDVAYAETLEATGADQSYTWSLAPGSGPLPVGLTLSTAGAVAGSPTLPGAFQFTVRVASGDGQSAERPLSITVPPVLEPHESCGDYPAHAIATFEDPALEFAVRQRLSDEQADLTCATVATVTAVSLGLYAQVMGVASLVGAQNLTGLTSLSFGESSSISDLGPISGLTGLERIGLTGNDIVDLGPISGLTNLTRLNLRDNMISDVSALAGLVNLEFLWLGRGAYSYVQKFGIPEVRGDPIMDISALSGLTSLEELWIPGQAIANLDALSGMTSLQELNAYANAISDMSGVAGHPSLQNLILDSNAITDLSPLAGLGTLANVLLRDNAITDVSGVESLTGLREIRLDANVVLSDIHPLLDNPGFGGPYPPPPAYDGHDLAGLTSTSVSCEDVALLEARDILVSSDCP
jgi:hypothetical protein